MLTIGSGAVIHCNSAAQMYALDPADVPILLNAGFLPGVVDLFNNWQISYTRGTPIDEPDFTVIINNNPPGVVVGQSGTGAYATDEVVNLAAGTKTGYTFNGWTVDAGGITLANANSATTTFTMPKNDVIIIANWIAVSETMPLPPPPIFVPVLVPVPVPAPVYVAVPTPTPNVPIVEGFFPPRGGFTFAPDMPVARGELAQAIFNLHSSRFTPLGAIITFSDTINSPFSEAIDFVSAMGFMNGYPDGTFRPYAHLSRGEAATVLSRIYGLTGQGTTQFIDTQGHWAVNYIALAADRRIINGYPDITFRPNNPLSRAEAAALLVRADGRDPMVHLQQQRFVDVTEAHWAFNYIMNASVPRQ